MKVYAKSAAMLKHHRRRWHPKGTAFDSNGMADWPNDSFTQRRIRDGDVTLEKPKEERAHPQHRSTTHRTESKTAT
jgi:hypothetical protein